MSAQGTQCSTEACSCHKQHLACTSYCNCSGKDNCCNPYLKKNALAGEELSSDAREADPEQSSDIEEGDSEGDGDSEGCAEEDFEETDDSDFFVEDTY